MLRKEGKEGESRFINAFEVHFYGFSSVKRESPEGIFCLQRGKESTGMGRGKAKSWRVRAATIADVRRKQKKGSDGARGEIPALLIP